MSTSFDLNRTQILRNAYRLANLIPDGEDPDSGQLATGTDFLDLILKDMQNRGIMLRKVERTTVELSAGTDSYALDSSTLDVDPMTPFVTDTNGNDTTVKMIPRGAWMEISNKDIQGQPTQMYVEKGSTITVYLYPVPDSNWTTLTVPRVVVIDDMSSATSTTGLQAKYLLTIVTGVAQMLAFANGLMDKSASLMDTYEKQFSISKNDDTERGPTRFVPSYGIRMGRF